MSRVTAGLSASIDTSTASQSGEFGLTEPSLPASIPASELVPPSELVPASNLVPRVRPLFPHRRSARRRRSCRRRSSPRRCSIRRPRSSPGPDPLCRTRPHWSVTPGSAGRRAPVGLRRQTLRAARFGCERRTRHSNRTRVATRHLREHRDRRRGWSMRLLPARDCRQRKLAALVFLHDEAHAYADGRRMWSCGRHPRPRFSNSRPKLRPALKRAAISEAMRLPRPERDCRLVRVDRHLGRVGLFVVACSSGSAEPGADGPAAGGSAGLGAPGPSGGATDSADGGANSAESGAASASGAEAEAEAAVTAA